MKDKYKDLKAMFVCTLIALIVTPIVYAVVFLPFGWWMQ